MVEDWELLELADKFLDAVKARDKDGIERVLHGMRTYLRQPDPGQTVAIVLADRLEQADVALGTYRRELRRVSGAAKRLSERVSDLEARNEYLRNVLDNSPAFMKGKSNG